MSAPRLTDHLLDGFAACALSGIVLLPAYFALGFVTGVFGICTSASPEFLAFYTDVGPWIAVGIALAVGAWATRASMKQQAREEARDEPAS